MVGRAAIHRRFGPWLIALYVLAIVGRLYSIGYKL
jgi:hypothetical protein